MIDCCRVFICLRRHAAQRQRKQREKPRQHQLLNGLEP